jgi:hypothetical protein
MKYFDGKTKPTSVTGSYFRRVYFLYRGKESLSGHIRMTGYTLSKIRYSVRPGVAAKAKAD